MKNFLPRTVRSLIEEFAKLPGMGPKSAQRLAMFLLRSPVSRVKALGDAVNDLQNNISFCPDCWNLTEESGLCEVCKDEGRDRSVICVVEEILDAYALEKTREYRGLYHILHGALSPIDGVGPEELKIASLLKRITNDSAIKEIILATNPSMEGETTALYIQKNLPVGNYRVTRIARGLPIGGDLEYADEGTLSRAMRGRTDF